MGFLDKLLPRLPKESVTAVKASQGASIEKAVIVEVYQATYTCLVNSVSTHRTIEVPFSVPVLHHVNGAGINFMPQVGDLCYLCSPADNDDPFILGFIYEEDPRDGRIGERLRLQPGDISLTTEDDNFVILKRGGVVQIGASSMAQRIYLPIENLVRDYFQKYHGFSPLGEIVWDHAKIGMGEPLLDPAKDAIPVIVKFGCRELVNDQYMSIEFRAGSLTDKILDASLDANLRPEGEGHTVEFGDGTSVEVEPIDFEKNRDKEHFFAEAASKDESELDDNHSWKGKILNHYDPSKDDSVPGLLSFTINPQGEAVKYVFQVNKEGSNFIKSEALIHIETGKGFFVSSASDPGIRLETADKQYLEIRDYIRLQTENALVNLLKDGTIDLESLGGDITIKSSTNVTVEAQGTVTVIPKGLLMLDSATGISLGVGTNELLKSKDMADWLSKLSTFLQTHTHPVAGEIAGNPLTAPGGGPAVASKTEMAWDGEASGTGDFIKTK